MVDKLASRSFFIAVMILFTSGFFVYIDKMTGAQWSMLAPIIFTAWQAKDALEKHKDS